MRGKGRTPSNEGMLFHGVRGPISGERYRWRAKQRGKELLNNCRSKLRAEIDIFCQGSLCLGSLCAEVKGNARNLKFGYHDPRLLLFLSTFHIHINRPSVVKAFCLASALQRWARMISKISLQTASPSTLVSVLAAWSAASAGVSRANTTPAATVPLHCCALADFRTSRRQRNVMRLGRCVKNASEWICHANGRLVDLPSE